MRTGDENQCGKLSYWKGDDSEPLKNITIGQLVEQAAERYSDNIAISIFGGMKLTFSEVLKKVDSLAAAFMNLGFKKGNHIALWGFNTIEWYLSFLAASRAGLVAVSMNPLYQSSELLLCLKLADVDALILDEQLGDHNLYNILNTAIPEIKQFDYDVHITSKEVPSLKTIISMSKQRHKGTFKWNDLLSMINDDARLQIKENLSMQSAFDVCNMQFTSGTTGDPKCVLLTHHNIINAARISARRRCLYEKPHRLCLQVPFFHVYGAVHGILAAIDSGCTVFSPHVKFSPYKSVDCIIAEKCSIIYGTPTMYSDILSVIQARAADDDEIFKKLSSIEVFHSSGAICLPQIIRQLKKYFENGRFLCGYGMTETSAAGFAPFLHDPEDVVLSTVGAVADHVEVKVIDENGELVPFRVAGELCCKGYHVMKGYYNNPTKTREVLDDDGWLHTGDRFILLENGYGKVVSRIKDIIIRGGENIAPKEVEQLLIKHPDIVDVQVYGVSDTRLGEVVAAAVIKAPNSSLNEESVKKYCKGMIASYKIPQHVIFVDRFPRTASGKIQKVKLREITEKQLSVEN